MKKLPLHRPVNLLTAFLILLALTTAGCSGGGSSTSSTNPAPSQTPTTVVQVNMGDAPSDWMLAFSMNLSSMALTGGNGSTSVVSSSMPMEMMHLMGMMQPVTMVSMPQGTYTGATVTMASCTATYIDPNTKVVAQKTLAGPFTATITFSSPITVGSMPMTMGFDLNLAKSVSMDSNGNMTFSPVFQISSGMQGSGSPSDYMNGGIQGMMGVISSVSGSSFIMTSMQAAKTFTFMTNSSTVFTGGTIGSMSNGMTVLVDATMQSDGSLLATRVQSMNNASGMMGGGIITAVTGNPITSLTMVMQNGVGSGMMGSYFAEGITVNIASGATFGINQSDVNMSGLPFTPTFDAGHIYVGQSVMPVSTSGMMSGGMGGGMMGGSTAGTITASAVYLEQQGLRGTTGSGINPSSTSSFVLTLPSDSAFTTLTGSTTVTVYQQASTIVTGGSVISSGTAVHAYGLLFLDAGKWKMVASRIGAN